MSETHRRRWGTGPAGAAVALALVVTLAASCSSTTNHPVSNASATRTLQAAAAATAAARSWSGSLASGAAHFAYQAPDSYLEVQHGEGAFKNSAGDSGTFREVITNIDIGTVDYAADTKVDERPSDFASSAYCPGSNMAEIVLNILRGIATTKTSSYSDGRYQFDIPKGAKLPAAIGGTATVGGGYVTGLVIPGPHGPLAVTLGSVNKAPPITVPSKSHKTETDLWLNCR